MTELSCITKIIEGSVNMTKEISDGSDTGY